MFEPGKNEEEIRCRGLALKKLGLLKRDPTRTSICQKNNTVQTKATIQQLFARVNKLTFNLCCTLRWKINLVPDC